MLTQKNRTHKSAFTLAELLVAVFLGLIILGMVTYSFYQTQKASNRALAMLDAHHKARVIIAKFRDDILSMNPCAPMDLGVSGTTTVTQITFLRNAYRLNTDYDSTTTATGWPITGEDLKCDLQWVKYQFDATNNSILYAELPVSGTVSTTMPPAGLTGHTMLDNISGRFVVLSNTGGVAGNTAGVNTDGTISAPKTLANRPALIKMILRVYGKDVGASGTTAGEDFSFTIGVPGTSE